MENNLKNERNYLGVQFRIGGFSDEPIERKEQINELIKKRNEILASRGIIVSSNSAVKHDITPSHKNEVLTNIEEIDDVSRFKAGIVGFVVGDALGVPIEFSGRDALEKKPLTEMIGYGSYDVPEGTWSDDTSLMLATMDSIIEVSEIDYDDIMKRFTNWVDYAKYTATDKVFDIGISTSNAIANYKSGIKAIECGTKGFYENGNGSLMRMLPIALYLCTNDFNEIEEIDIINKVSSLTHAHEISCLGCKMFSDYIKALINGLNKIEALNFVRVQNYKRYYSQSSISFYKRILNGELPNLKKSDIKSSGFVVDTLEASIWCTLMSDSYEQSVVTAVNLGYDTDTIGAITGALNGIIYGEESIPKRWVDKLKKRDYLEQISQGFIKVLENSKTNHYSNK